MDKNGQKFNDVQHLLSFKSEDRKKALLLQLLQLLQLLVGKLLGKLLGKLFSIKRLAFFRLSSERPSGPSPREYSRVRVPSAYIYTGILGTVHKYCCISVKGKLVNLVTGNW